MSFNIMHTKLLAQCLFMLHKTHLGILGEAVAG